MTKEQKWEFLTKTKAERRYRGYVLTLHMMPVPRRKIDVDSGDFDDDIWKWFVHSGNIVVRQGYANTFDEASKIAEFNAREHASEQAK